MKQGISLQELATEVDRQNRLKKDYMAPTPRLRMVDQGAVTVQEVGLFRPSEVAHRQIADKIGVPWKYYDRMRAGAPELLAENVNHWFEREPSTRMVRTMGSTMRAFLSDRYRRLDNYDLMSAILPALNDLPNDVAIQSTALTETKLYVKLTVPALRGEVRVGEIVEAGLTLTNSEVGMGGFEVAEMVMKLACLNGMKVPASGMRRTHVGRANQAAEDYTVFSDEALAADDKAFFLKVRDTVRATLSETGFRKTIDRLRQAAGQPIQGSPVQAVEQLANRFNLAEGESAGVLEHLIRGGDLSQWGLINAVTRFSQDVEDYDRASEFEELGGKILTLGRSEWRQIAEAA